LYSGDSSSECVIPDFVEFKELDSHKITGDAFLSLRKRDFSELTKQGHEGFGLYDKNKFFAYAWIASERDSTPPPLLFIACGISKSS